MSTPNLVPKPKEKQQKATYIDNESETNSNLIFMLSFVSGIAATMLQLGTNLNERVGVFILCENDSGELETVEYVESHVA